MTKNRNYPVCSEFPSKDRELWTCEKQGRAKDYLFQTGGMGMSARKPKLGRANQEFNKLIGPTPIDPAAAAKFYPNLNQ